jgi:FkbM family methyltransferase
MKTKVKSLLSSKSLTGETQMKTVFDIGMYDGSDTEYFLSEGYRVIAIEANPALIKRAERVFRDALSARQLTLVNAAIASDLDEVITLNICGDDLGSSSIYDDMTSARTPLGSYTVQGITIQKLIEEYGVPYYLKVDIEGADRFCILPIASDNRPKYISFEAGNDFEELLGHLTAVGFTKFKLINQVSFRELSNQRNMTDRVRRKIMHWLGYGAPTYIRYHGRFFKSMHSSGPFPWLSDGDWCSAKELLEKWKRARVTNQLRDWYDVHGM